MTRKQLQKPKFKACRLIPRKCLWSLFGLLMACSPEKAEDPAAPKQFASVAASHSNVHFENKIEDSEAFNYFQYIYAYIGGGVAAADFDQDGNVDLFFTSNRGSHGLYRNKGDFSFEDLTENAGITKKDGFDTGVTVADVNEDGLPDIYLCRAGWFDDPELLANQLYINNGDFTFTEKASAFGLADTNRSIQSTFFDYDRDGDLDVFIANAAKVTKDYRAIHPLDKIQTDTATITLLGSDQLYRNEGGHFTNVSAEAGLLPERGFGLHAQVGDINQDGWPDIYVCNDFETPDFVYLNNQDGTFADSRARVLKHMSFYSMGADMADVNNDGLLDVMTLDMSPEDYVRSKTTMAMTSLAKFSEMVDQGYHHQYMHNMLQMNNGDGTFSEIGQMAGVDRTDWSWATLLADFDLDGYNDVYVTNGVFRDVIDQDKNNQIVSTLRANRRKPTPADYLTFTERLPQQKLVNYFFKNKGDLTFENQSTVWADSVATFSNGAAYADLDNDGDLDLVVNNINDKATLLRNNAREIGTHHFLKVRLKGSDRNKFGVGATVTLHLSDGIVQTRQLINSRGFLSATGNELHFGLGQHNEVKTAAVVWPDGREEKLENVSADQAIEFDYSHATQRVDTVTTAPQKALLFNKVDLNLAHQDPSYNDYADQLLLPHKLSQTGPASAKGDVNGDGLEDVFVGGGHNQPGQLFIHQKSGQLVPQESLSFVADRSYEDVGACFFDADNDGDLDLYVVSGSYEFRAGSPLLQDRLYLNNGAGNFTKSTDALPQFREAGSVVAPSDFDQDGDVDLFVGGRVVPGAYPYPPKSYLLLNTSGRFTIATDVIASELADVGMVTDAVWDDLDQDGDPDLIVTGEWMGIEVFENTAGKLFKSTKYTSLSEKKGWWAKLLVTDIDQDGDRDIVSGNLGLNYKHQASENKPFHVYAGDFQLFGRGRHFFGRLLQEQTSARAWQKLYRTANALSVE